MSIGALAHFKDWFRELTSEAPDESRPISALQFQQVDTLDPSAPCLPPDKQLDSATANALKGTVMDADFAAAIGDFVAPDASDETRRQVYHNMFLKSTKRRKYVDGAIHYDVSAAQKIRPPQSKDDPVEYSVTVELHNGDLTTLTVLYPHFGDKDYPRPEDADMQELLTAAQAVGNSLGAPNARQTASDLGGMIGLGDRANYSGQVSMGLPPPNN